MRQLKSGQLMKRLRWNSGFTLIEVLAAVIVLSFGIVVVLRAFETSLAAMGSSRSAVWGNLLVREILAETRLDMRKGDEIPSYASGIYEIGPYKDFRWEREVELLNSFAGNNNKTKIFLYKVGINVWRSNLPSVKYSVATYMRQIR